MLFPVRLFIGTIPLVPADALGRCSCGGFLGSLQIQALLPGRAGQFDHLAKLAFENP